MTPRIIRTGHGYYLRIQTAIWAAALATLVGYLVSTHTSKSTSRLNQTIEIAKAVEPVPAITPTPAPLVTTDEHIGVASYYSREGCIGCSENMIMANGKPLDDSKLTVAYNRAKLGARVEITNRNTGAKVEATVTDRGGFERHGKIIDLTIATRDALGCGDTCQVKVRIK